MGFHVEIESCDGASFRGYEAPAEGSTTGSVLIVHEWFGLNDNIRAHADRVSALGFHALAVDLFDGRVAPDAAVAKRLAAGLTTEHAMRVIQAAIDHVRKRPGVTGKVGIAGFCLGGAVALAAASKLAGVSATVTFGGLPAPRYADVSSIRVPVMGHYGLRDPVLPIAHPKKVFAELSAAGTRAWLHEYDAGHAFMRDTSQSYRANVAELAWQRTAGMLREELL
jgi:carboxymethylenebutenolidase